MGKKLMFLFVLLLQLTVSGQVRVLDNVTFEAVAGVNLYADSGAFLGRSGVGGVIFRKSLKKVKTERVTIQHVSYENTELSWEDFVSSQVVLLSPRSIRIEDVKVMDQVDYDYVLLKGYFRSYDLFDNDVKYFYDGIVEHYIPLRSKKGKVYQRVISYRLYADSNTEKAFRKAFGKLFVEPPRLLRIKGDSILDRLPKGIEISSENGQKILRKDGLNMGFVQKSKSGLIQTYFNHVPPNKTISRKFFSVRGEQYLGVETEQYQQSELDNPVIENLVSKTKVSVGAAKRKKRLEYLPFESSAEFYVLERVYLRANTVNERKSSFVRSTSLGLTSNFQGEFWKELKEKGIPPLVEGISKKLDRELVLQ